MKTTTKIMIGFSVLASLGAITACGNGVSTNGASAPNASTTYTQIERLGRPAINEGLVLSNANLNAFNSIPPSFDLRSDVPAVAAVLNEATVVLTVVHNLGIAASQPAPPVATVAGQFLPDVLRIDTADADYAYPLTPNADRTGNSRQEDVAYASCVSVAAGAPLLCGGRKIRDDVIDITLSYIAAGAGAANPESTLTNVPAYLVKDNINYATAHLAANPLLTVFPFLAAPL